MSEQARSFTVASDEALVSLIARARDHLVVIAPALTKPVGDAIVSRLSDLDHIRMTVILDSDPEVYRLGFGDADALEAVRKASAEHLFDLREQSGVRIGVIISDGTTMVYSPVSKNIEAGSTTVEKPNAIMLGGNVARDLATAAGAVEADDAPPPEIGQAALEPERVAAMQADLKANPPKPFDIARRMNVFSSRVQYVEFSASNYRLTTRRIALPTELVDVADAELKESISGQIRAPFEGVGALNIEIEGKDGAVETLKVDDAWLRKERKRIEDEYTFQINNFGRVILSVDRDAFDKAVTRFQSIVENYQLALKDTLLQLQATFEKRIVKEYLPRWQRDPPKHFERWRIEPTEAAIRQELTAFASKIFEDAIAFDPPTVRTLYKNVAPENIADPAFLDVLKGIMEKRRVPKAVIDTLFQTGQAAPESGAFERDQ